MFCWQFMWLQACKIISTAAPVVDAVRARLHSYVASLLPCKCEAPSLRRLKGTIVQTSQKFMVATSLTQRTNGASPLYDRSFATTTRRKVAQRTIGASCLVVEFTVSLWRSVSKSSFYTLSLLIAFVRSGSFINNRNADMKNTLKLRMQYENVTDVVNCIIYI